MPISNASQVQRQETLSSRWGKVQENNKVCPYDSHDWWSYLLFTNPLRSMWYPLKFKGSKLSLHLPSSLWFCSKNKKSLSSTNTASCVLDSSLFQYLSVSLSRLLPIYRDTQVSQWTRIRDRGKSHVSPRYLLQLPFNAKLVKSGLLFPAIPQATMKWLSWQPPWSPQDRI